MVNKQSSVIELHEVTIREWYRYFSHSILKHFHIAPVGVVAATETAITDTWMSALSPKRTQKQLLSINSHLACSMINKILSSRAVSCQLDSQTFFHRNAQYSSFYGFLAISSYKFINVDFSSVVWLLLSGRIEKQLKMTSEYWKSKSRVQESTLNLSKTVGRQ